MNQEWKAQSTVTIPLEYYEHLLEREKTLKELLKDIRQCFDFNNPNDATVDIDRLFEVALKTTDEYFDCVVNEESVRYTNITKTKLATR